MAIKINGDNTVANPGFSGDDTDTGLQVGTDELKLVTGGTARATVDSSGRLNIGATSNAYTDALLQTSTSVGSFFVTRNSHLLLQNKNSSTTNWWSIAPRDNGNLTIGNGAPDSTGVVTDQKIVIDSSGQVGIGTTSPGRQLTLSHASQAEIGLLSGADTSGALIYQNASEQKLLVANRESDGHIAFQTGGANERMRIDSSGVVKLTQSGSNPRYGSLEASGDAFKLKAFSGSSGHNATMQFFTGTNSPEERLRIDQDGVLFLGNSSSTINYIANTNHAAKMHLGGGGGGSANIEIHGSTHSSDPKVITFDTNSLERMRIRSDGHILIGGTTFGASGVITLRNDGFLAAPSIYATVVSSARDMHMDSSGYFGYLSSVRESKTNIQVQDNVDWLYQLEPVTFNYKTRDRETGEYTGDVESELEYGLIAEDVETVCPDLCFYDETDGGPELRGVSYKKLITPMLKALQDAKAKIETLETQNADLAARITALETA